MDELILRRSNMELLVYHHGHFRVRLLRNYILHLKWFCNLKLKYVVVYWLFSLLFFEMRIPFNHGFDNIVEYVLYTRYSSVKY